MQTSDPFTRPPSADRPTLLVLCLIFSLLLHLLVVIGLPLLQRQAPSRLLTAKPTMVRLVDKPEPRSKPDQPAEYELDQKPPSVDQAKPEIAKRLAERQQRVEKEQAPRGTDSRDEPVRLPPRALPAPPQAPVAERLSTQEQSEKKASSDPSPRIIVREKQGTFQESPPVEPRRQTLPTLEQLTRLAPSTLDRLAEEGLAVREKIKQREDVEAGDEVWLNLEQGLLISFFRRFRTQIEGVWNYPQAAVESGIEGVLLLKIIVNREGDLLDVDLITSSGSNLLDFEAIQAVYRGAPFGPLPKQYSHPELKINAYFRYQIGGKFIYGR